MKRKRVATGVLGSRPQQRLKAALAAVASRPFRAPARRSRRDNIELKGVDTELAIAGPIISTTNTNADAFVLNLIPPGTASFNRVGRKCILKTARLYGNAQYSYAGTATTGVYNGSVLRMVVVWDKQPSGALPAFDTIFGSTDQAGTESADVLDPVRYDSMDRFRILRDTRIVANPTTGNAEGGTLDSIELRFLFDEFIKLPNLETTYSGQSATQTIADISSGGLYVFFRADESVDTTADWTIHASSKCRLRYVD